MLYVAVLLIVLATAFVFLVGFSMWYASRL
jgi:hypothetical protein